MAHKTWTLQLEDGAHVVELDHGTFSGKRALTVDGQVIERGWKTWDPGSQHCFRLNGHEVIVRIKSNALQTKYTYDLALDGLSQETHLRAEWAKPLPAWVPRVTTQPGEKVAVSTPSPNNAVGAEALNLLMQNQVRQWGTTLLLMGVLHLIGSGLLSASWGVLLLAVGAASFVLVDAVLFTVYAVTLAWAGVSNLLGGSSLWVIFGLFQFVLAYRVFKQGAVFRRAQATREGVGGADGQVQETPRTPAARTFKWLGSLLGGIAFAGSAALFVWPFIIGIIAPETQMPAAYTWLIRVVPDVAVLGIGVSLGAMLASHRDKLLPAIGLATSALALLLWFAMIFLFR